VQGNRRDVHFTSLCTARHFSITVRQDLSKLLRFSLYYKYYVSGHYPLSCFYLKHRLEIGTSSINWAQLSRFCLKTDRIQSLTHCVLKYKQDVVLDKNSIMDNSQKHHICTNVPSSQTFRSYFQFILLSKY
jgi:hypothetical protein